MSEMLPKAVQDKDLSKAFFSAVVAALFMGFVMRVTNPSFIHAVIGLVSVGLVVAAFLFVARAKVDRDWQAAAIIGLGVIGLVVLRLLARN